LDNQTGTWADDPYCHRNMGFGTLVANCGVQAGNDSDGWFMANLSSPTQHTWLAQTNNAPNRWNTDSHPSYNNAQAGISAPFFVDNRVSTPLPLPPRAWDDELIALATDGSNKVWRF